MSNTYPSNLTAYLGISNGGVTTPSSYLGTYNASTNTPTLANGTGVAGNFYLVTVAGTNNPTGINIPINHNIVYNGAIWQDGGIVNNSDGISVATDYSATSGTVSIGQSLTSALGHLAYPLNNATNNNIASTIVKRDSSGNFSAGSITANLLGNSNTAYLSNGLKPYSTSAPYLIGDMIVGDGTNGLIGQILCCNTNVTGAFVLADWDNVLLAQNSNVIPSGEYNTFFGTHSVSPTLSGSSALAIFGYGAGANLVTSANIVAIGSGALGQMTSAVNSTAIGANSGSLTTGIGNQYFGYQSGRDVDIGQFNTILGSYIGQSGAWNNNVIIADGQNNVVATWIGTATQTANYVLASPDSSTGPASMRALVADDIPTISYTQVSGLGTAATYNIGTTDGEIPVLGTSGLPAVGSGITTVTDPTTSSIDSLDTALANIHALAGAATDLEGGVLGSVPYQSAPNTTLFVAPNTSSTLQVLTQTGTGITGALPVWTSAVSTNTASALVIRDGSGNFSAGNITASLTGAASGNTTYTANQYGVVLSGSGNSMSVITPDASTVKVLTSGGASANPVWSQVAYSNVTGTPSLGTAAALNTGTSVNNVVQYSGTSTITASLTGNSSTATTLATTRAIYGNNFDGSAPLTQVIASTYGGTGNGFTKFTGPTTSEKTFTLPNQSGTLSVISSGSWTPVNMALTVVGSLTLTGTYILIGNIYYCTLTVQSTITTASNANVTYFSGLPGVPATQNICSAVDAGNVQSYGIGLVDTGSGGLVYTPTWGATAKVIISFWFSV